LPAKKAIQHSTNLTAQQFEGRTRVSGVQPVATTLFCISSQREALGFRIYEQDRNDARPLQKGLGLYQPGTDVLSRGAHGTELRAQAQ
jgi:hypothetical protein